MNSLRFFNRAVTYSRLSRPIVNNGIQKRQISYNNQNINNSRSLINGIRLTSGLGLVLYNIKKFKPYHCDSNNNKFKLDKYNLNTCLKAAAEIGDLELVKLLIEQGADVKANNNYALRYASENGHLEVVKLLIEHGADVKAYDNYAIRHASAKGHLEVVKVLIEHGADVKDNDNYAIKWASDRGHLEVVKLLIEHGANVQIALNNCSYSNKKFILDFIEKKLNNDDK